MARSEAYRQHAWGRWKVTPKGLLTGCTRVGCYARQGLQPSPERGLIRCYKEAGDQQWLPIPPPCRGAYGK